jgi:hypothetical protein
MFLRTGSFPNDLSKGEKRRVRTMALTYKLEMKGEKSGRLLYFNHFDNWVPVPKQSEIVLILRSFHDDPCAGHYAGEITYRRIYDAFYWPTVRKDTFDYVKTCDTC